MSTKELEKKVEEHDASIKLTNQKFELVVKGITIGMDGLTSSMKDLKTTIDNGFVTKEQFERVKSDVDDLKSLKAWALKIIVGAIMVALLGLVIVRTQ